MGPARAGPIAYHAGRRQPRACRSVGIRGRLAGARPVAASVHACTTHLALGVNGISLAQCRYLLDTAIPAMRLEGEGLPTIVGGDLNNLGATDALPCLPARYSHTDDGAVQQVMASAGLVIGSSRTIDMRGATDHPGLIVTFGRQRQGMAGGGGPDSAPPPRAPR